MLLNLLSNITIDAVRFHRLLHIIFTYLGVLLRWFSLDFTSMKLETPINFEMCVRNVFQEERLAWQFQAKPREYVQVDRDVMV